MDKQWLSWVLQGGDTWRCELEVYFTGMGGRLPVVPLGFMQDGSKFHYLSLDQDRTEKKSQWERVGWES